MSGVTVLLPALNQMTRRPYLLGFNSLDERWVWSCPVCGWRTVEVEKIDAEAAANQHECEAGWSALPGDAQ